MLVKGSYVKVEQAATVELRQWVVMGKRYALCKTSHNDVTKWKHFPRHWPFVRGIHRLLVNSLHKGQWRGALIFSLICAWIKSWVNNRKAGDLRQHGAHYDVTVIFTPSNILRPCKTSCGGQIDIIICVDQLISPWTKWAPFIGPLCWESTGKRRILTQRVITAARAPTSWRHHVNTYTYRNVRNDVTQGWGWMYRLVGEGGCYVSGEKRIIHISRIGPFDGHRGWRRHAAIVTSCCVIFS